jgi:ATP-dependent DNA helicase RecQ
MSFIEQAEQQAKNVGLYPLREPQRRALEELAQGHDLLLVWPTGSGKSLCYQLPALVREGLTVVISPLIALMEDQVAQARKRGWPMTCIHSGVGREERERRLASVVAGKIKLLYVTPERFRQEGFQEEIQKVKISLMAVDEAHCISQWGHDFRPDYSRLKEIREILGKPQVMALTATATTRVQEDIWKQLGVEPIGKTFWEGVERPNLHLSVAEVDEVDDKIDRVKDWLKETRGTRIIYFTLISTLEKTADDLRAVGVDFATYHGDMEDRAKSRALKEFISGEKKVILATPAFGLGVDKPDVRGVLHFETPASIEAYYQEVGRAGRDGQPSHCLLLYQQNDLEIQMRFIDSLTPEPAYLRAVLKLLEDWKGRLGTLELDDLRAQLSFKNKRDFRLETALNVLDRWDFIRYPKRSLKQLVLLRPLAELQFSEEEWKARRLEMHKKLMSMVELVRGENCRKLKIYQYFGWPEAKPCGFCDRCD